MYLDTMQQIYGSVTKVLVESRQGSNLLYLPLDKIMQGVTGGGGASDAPTASSSAPVAAPAVPSPTFSNDPRARDSSRTRDRESR
jgi:membrane protease subunit HflK